MKLYVKQNKTKGLYKFIIILLLAPSICFGLSGNNIDYLGYLENGKTITINNISGSEESTDWKWIYGINQSTKFKSCWNYSINSEYKKQYFKCANKYKGKQTVLYKIVPTKTKLYKKAMVIYKKPGNCEDSLLKILVCKIGCDNNTPKFLFELGHDGYCLKEYK